MGGGLGAHRQISRLPRVNSEQIGGRYTILRDILNPYPADHDYCRF